jgi:hypothetical protein
MVLRQFIRRYFVHICQFLKNSFLELVDVHLMDTWGRGLDHAVRQLLEGRGHVQEVLDHLVD